MLLQPPVTPTPPPTTTPSPVPVVLNPVINVPAPEVHEVSASGGTPWWVTLLIALAVALVTAYVARSRDHQKWLWERRVDLYLTLVRGVLAEDLKELRTKRIPLRSFEERFDAATVYELKCFGGPLLYPAFIEYSRVDDTTREQWAERGADQDLSRGSQQVQRMLLAHHFVRGAIDEELVSPPSMLLPRWVFERRVKRELRISQQLIP